MARYGSWDDRPREWREGGRDWDRWRRERDAARREDERWSARDEWGEPRGYGPEHRPAMDRPWVERGPRARWGREDSRGLVEWEDRGPLEWLGDRFREARRPSRGPKGYTRSDERIHDEVCERIARSGVDAEEVEVKVEKAQVTLTGTVRSRAEKWRLEEVAEDVFGVEDVHNHVRIAYAEASEPRGPSGRTDTGAIEGRIRH